MIFMKRMLTVALLAVLLVPAAMTGTVAPDSPVMVPGETVHVADGMVTLTVVFESQTGDYNGTVDVRAPSDATFTCQGVALDPTWSDGVATVDLGAHGLSIPADGNITLTARYPRDGDVVHRMLYDATVTVTVESDAYVRASIPLSYVDGGYTGTASLRTDDVVTVSFAPVGGGDGNVMLYLAGGVIVGAMAAGAAMYLLQRRGGDRRLEKEPVEALEMRKKLLTRLLKQLEIERDKNKIADAYYQSIKDSFKEQAVEVMREIDRRS